jgi:hypothetical protein
MKSAQRFNPLRDQSLAGGFASGEALIDTMAERTDQARPNAMDARTRFTDPMAQSAAQKVQIREREAQVMALRRGGVSFREIGRLLDISESTAFDSYKRVMRSLNELSIHDAKEIKALQISRYEDILSAVWARATGGICGLWTGPSPSSVGSTSSRAPRPRGGGSSTSTRTATGGFGEG